MNNSPDHPEHDDAPREQPIAPGDGRQNTDYPNDTETTEGADDGRANG